MVRTPRAMIRTAPSLWRRALPRHRLPRACLPRASPRRRRSFAPSSPLLGSGQSALRFIANLSVVGYSCPGQNGFCVCGFRQYQRQFQRQFQRTPPRPVAPYLHAPSRHARPRSPGFPGSPVSRPDWGKSCCMERKKTVQEPGAADGSERSFAVPGDARVAANEKARKLSCLMEVLSLAQLTAAAQSKYSPRIYGIGGDGTGRRPRPDSGLRTPKHLACV